MDFEKKYPITQMPNEFILVQWTRGFKEVDIYFRDELIASARGSKNLLNGVSISTSQLGLLKLKLSEKPITLDIIIDRYHSPINVSHPVKELKRLATYFWLIAVMSFVAGALEIGVVIEFPKALAIVAIINVTVFVTYIISALFTGRGKPWAYLLGYILFAFFTLLTLLIILLGAAEGILLYIFQTIRVGALVVLSINLKTAIDARKHLRYSSIEMDDLLDSKL